MNQTEQKQIDYLWAMVLVLLIASLFYLFRLNLISFWEDESWMVIATSDSPAYLWQFAAERGAHPPLYFYLIYLAQFAIGTSEFALRWFGGLVALIGLAFTYRLGADTVNKPTGVFTAFLTAGSLLLVYLARLARHYTLFYTLAVAIFVLYWRWRKTPSRRLFWTIVILQTCAIYTHYYAVFVAGIIALHALITLPRQHSFKLIAGLALAGICFIPWLPQILVQLDSPLIGDGLQYGVRGVLPILDNYWGRITNAHWFFGISFGIIGLWAIWRERLYQTGLLILIGVATLIPVIIINETLFQWYIGRNMLYTLPLVTLLYGIGLANLSRKSFGRVLAIVGAGAFVTYGMFAFPVFWPGTADWRDLMRVVVRDAHPDDLFVVQGEPYTTDYYLRQHFGVIPNLVPMRTWLNDPQGASRIWFISAEHGIPPQAVDALPDGMQQTRQQIRLPLVAELYQQLPDEPIARYDQQMALGYRGETPLTVRRGATLTLDVWWMALRRPDFNYSASFQIWGQDFVLVQQDGNFNGGRLDAQVLPIGIWIADTRQLTIPPDAPLGTYTLKVTVYDWRDQTRLTVSPESIDDLLPLVEVVVLE